MEAEKILEGNKMIAEFMGYTADAKGFHKSGEYVDGNGDKHFTGMTIKNVLYDTSWDWLMPVIEHIENSVYGSQNTSFSILIGKDSCLIASNFPDYHFEGNGKTKIDASYKAIIQFLTWYNQQ